MYPKAILFDMDGTLTEERLQWDDLRADLGVQPGEAILEAIHRMSGAERARAETVLHHHEQLAAERSVLNPGCREMLTWMDTRGIGRALITRNTRASVRTVFDRCGLHFDIAITREDGLYKPDPAPLLLACQQLGVAPAEAWMVGDWKYDIMAANAAGIHAVWLSFGRARVFEAVPDRVCFDLLSFFDAARALVPSPRIPGEG